MIAKSEMKLYIFLLNYEKKKIIKLSNRKRKKILFKIIFNIMIIKIKMEL